MPQLFGAEELDLIRHASLFHEAAPDERTIEKATHPAVAAEARARGLVPLRMGRDPIWHHPETGQKVSLTPAHSGDSANYTSMANMIAKLKRTFPTDEETARASRSVEDVEAEQSANAVATRSKKQQDVEARRRARERDEAAAAKAQARAELERSRAQFASDHAPFANMGEIKKAFEARTPKAKAARPDDTPEAFAARLRGLTPASRMSVHKSVFPERY